MRNVLFDVQFFNYIRDAYDIRADFVERTAFWQVLQNLICCFDDIVFSIFFFGFKSYGQNAGFSGANNCIFQSCFVDGVGKLKHVEFGFGECKGQIKFKVRHYLNFHCQELVR